MNLSEALTGGAVLHMGAAVAHARRGPLAHSFNYTTDYVLLAPEHAQGRRFFSRNGFNLLSVHDRDHGGERGAGRGAEWARERFSEAGLDCSAEITIALLTQPRLLGHWFTPVSFWIALQGEAIRAVIAEVNNTFGQRHSYMCRLDDFHPICPGDTISASKVFHVSPFQDVSGTYHFRFSVQLDRIAIAIAYTDGENGLDAVMSGRLRQLTTSLAINACLRRPGGSLRVLFLIYWNALRLKLRGARYRPLPHPPQQDMTR